MEVAYAFYRFELPHQPDGIGPPVAEKEPHLKKIVQTFAILSYGVAEVVRGANRPGRTESEIVGGAEPSARRSCDCKDIITSICDSLE